MPSKKEKRAAAHIDRLVGQRLRARRVELRLSQTDLADGLGVTFQQVQKYESGTNRLGSSRLLQAAGVLMVPPSYFFVGPELPVHLEREDEDLARVAEFLADKAAQALMRAFQRIESKALRRSIAEMITAAAEGSL